ncbi:MAG: dihydropteroate synthase [Omnitrophica bacterium RIFCSPHIGHO2_02_FULL_46_11]|nr:MAG: dihydropteroate synthase [Omnitrophica bacterium RIFCSPHIGHO2_02_FULL_46_11]OGW87835.1 MAG: dihydropteroate synthase [Omnitrophica bacterium RIFCSPLOWO2_01_FULL_45_10b]
MIWKIRAAALTLERPLMMGVLNLTPDSFYDGGRFLNPAQAVEQAFRLIQEGADILDVGAESTKPAAKPVSAEEEWHRLAPVLEALKGQVQVPISVDTTKAQVAKRALESGAQIINDVSGLRNDPKLAEVVREFDAGLVLMHRRGTPETMQLMADYRDVVEEVSRELSESMAIAEASGVSSDKIVLDPGIGFSKTADQSLELIERLAEFKRLGRPLLIGPSRKSFIGQVTKMAPDRRLFGTTAACVLAFERGANIFRVHDVWAVKEAILVAGAILNSGKKISL